jgi:RimJ/RimL family protein N-acetyltransferase
MAVPTLTDGVIVLNGYTNDDIAAHLAGEDEETARRFGWWPQTSTEATVQDSFDCWARNWETSGPIRTFAAREATTEQLLGGCELRLQPDGSAHVSYWTSATQRRHGYATRALALLLQYAGSIGFTQFETHVAEDNLASRRVSEKAGFHLASTFTDELGTGMIRYQACHHHGSREDVKT